MAPQSVRVTTRGYAVVGALAVVLLLGLGLVVKAFGSDGGQQPAPQATSGHHHTAIIGKAPPQHHLKKAPPQHQATSTPPPSARPHQLHVTGIAGPLTPGSCLSLPPTHGDRSQTVFLDPGHGGHDPGTSGTTSNGTLLYEKTATLAVAKQASKALRADGYTVVMSHTRDSDVVKLPPSDFTGSLFTPHGDHLEILSRIACANAAHASVLVSIHFNSFPDTAVGGAETYYDTSRSFGKSNKRLAQLVQADLMMGFQAAGWAVPDRGTASQTDQSGGALTAEGESYGHLLLLGPHKAGWNDHPSTMPGVLTEPLFLTRPTEADIAASPQGQHVMGLALAHALETFLAHE